MTPDLPTDQALEFEEGFAPPLAKDGYEWVHIGTHDNMNQWMQVRTRMKSDDVFATTGERRAFSTGAHRDANKDKGRMDLLPWDSLLRLSKHFQKGAKTHGERDWEKGMPLSSVLDSTTRHIAKIFAGYTDEDHLTAAFWGLAVAVAIVERTKVGTLPADLNDLNVK